jgi:CheY-like chemotaxis protein
MSSAPGNGSTFWFTCRLASRSSIDPAVARPEPELAGARVLCADDNPTCRLALARRLASWGLVVDCVADGAAALARMRVAAEAGAPYHLALLDHAMPGMDGVEAAAAVKADPSLAKTPVILITSWTQRGEATAGRKAGVWGCLTKPVRRANLHDCVALALRSRRAAASAAVTSAAAPSPAVGARPTPSAFVRGRILVVDDNTVNQRLAQRVLENLGYHVEVARNGREAIAAAQRATFDAVLMDCQMPEMDGYSATAEIRRIEGGARRTPIIAMTGSTAPADRERCLASGMDGYVAKPIRPDELASALERWGRSPTLSG